MHFIGTIHIDLEGPRRLNHILNSFEPNTITTETPKNISIKELKSYLDEQKTRLRNKIMDSDNPNNAKKLFCEWVESKGYEFLIPYEFTRKHPSNLHLVDHPEVFESYKDEIESISFEMDEDSKRILQRLDYITLRKAHVKQIDMFYGSPDPLITIAEKIPSQKYEKKEPKNEFIETREQFMADEIRKIRPDIHIGGLSHVFDDYKDIFQIKNVYKRLGELNPKRIKLCDAYKI